MMLSVEFLSPNPRGRNYEKKRLSRSFDPHDMNFLFRAVVISYEQVDDPALCSQNRAPGSM